MCLSSTSRWWLLLGGWPLLAGCSLTSENVEPALPNSRVDGSDIVVYRANGQPVVTNSSVDIITILVSFLGDPRPVVTKLSASNTLSIRATNTPPSGVASVTTRRLELVIPNFTGAGSYTLPAPARGSYSLDTYYQESSPSGSGTGYAYGPEYYVVPGVPARVTVTSWDITSRQLKGTFTLTVAPAGSGNPRLELTEGLFDVTVDK